MNTRKDNNGKALKAWKALGLAKIEKPLRYIRNKCAFTEKNAKGETVISYGEPYLTANIAANGGDGGFARRVALRLANGMF